MISDTNIRPSQLLKARALQVNNVPLVMIASIVGMTVADLDRALWHFLTVSHRDIIGAVK